MSLQVLAVASFASATFASATLLGWVPPPALAQPLSIPNCVRPGWFPTNFGLKDHSVFWFNGYYYLVSNYLPHENPGVRETQFAYGRSTDLCTWENLAAVLPQRIVGEWDEMSIWAPFVLEDAGVYYMFYTGVTFQFTQSIMLATSTNPADPSSWQRQGLVFQPDHLQMVYQNGAWADCRDPMVAKVGETYYLYYTGSDQSGAIIGIATATAPTGPWRDWGASVVSSAPGQMLESPTVILHDGLYYLVYNQAGAGARYRIGASPGGPWTAAMPLSRGWAHEIWAGQDGLTYTSFLTDYTVSISRLIWDTLFDPPRLFIGNAIYHVTLPSVLNTYP